MKWIRSLNWKHITGTIAGGLASAGTAIGVGTGLGALGASNTSQAIGGALGGTAALAAFVRYVVPRLLADADGDGRLAAADVDDTDPDAQ